MPEVDALLHGGLPQGAIAELAGSPSSGRTTLALSTLAGLTRQGHCCAYVDPCDTLDPLSAAALGVELRRLLWVRPGEGQEAQVERVARICPPFANVGSAAGASIPPSCFPTLAAKTAAKVGHPPFRLDAALRATDLLLNAGGWGALVLDLADVPWQQARRVPLATWYRFRLQAEKSRTLLLLLTPVACAHSCAALSLDCETEKVEWQQASSASPLLLAGLRYRLRAARNRDSRHKDSTPKKPAASAQAAYAETAWSSRTLRWG